MLTQNCTTGSIAPYTPSSSQPWNRQKAQHLYRRIGFAAPLATVDAAVNTTPSILIDQIVDQAITTPVMPAPIWENWGFDEYDAIGTGATIQRQHVNDIRIAWMTSLSTYGLRDKLTVFWHDHFATIFEDYGAAPHAYKYFNILQRNSLGNFKAFVHEVGLTPAMLLFLDGAFNVVGNPNENYARELYELFTMGVNTNYTEYDIEQTARALTGWRMPDPNFGYWGTASFEEDRHDNGLKTIFGVTANFKYFETYDPNNSLDIINHLFAQRTNEIATYICTKLYQEFVHPTVDESIVNSLASTFISNNFEIEPVVRQLLKSEHFFSEKFIGTKIKSPIEFYYGLFTQCGLDINSPIYGNTFNEYFLTDSSSVGQKLFSPPDVAGWPGHRVWVSSDRLISRWASATETMRRTNVQETNQVENLRSFAKNLTNNSNDPTLITQAIVDFVTPNGFENQGQYDAALTVFKTSWISENYYTQGLWNLDWDEAPNQISDLLAFISSQPVYQLN